jgi:nucleoside-diphosphate-sugar epimerase
MICLLTGASGFLGKTIFQELSKNCQVITLARSEGDYKFDLTAGIPKFSESFDLVIHSAGLAHFSSIDKRLSNSYYEVNVVGTEHLLKGLEQQGVPKRMVFISSVAVYGQLKGDSINESSDLKAIDPYGKSKIQTEELIFNWCIHHGVTCTILRLPLIAGLNAPGNLGAMVEGIRKGFYFNIARGLAKKSMVLASDVAKFILKASEVGGTFNLTDGYHPSFFELSSSISYQLGKCSPKNLPFWLAKIFALGGDLIGKYAPLNTGKLNKITSTLTFDDSKARKAFGWNPIPVLNGFKISNTK